MTILKDKMAGRRILIINPFGIGDVLFTTPVIRAIKAYYPDSFIAYWCNARVKPLLSGNRHIDRVFALARGDIKKLYRESFLKGFFHSLKLVSSIKMAKFDICLDFSLDHRYSLLSKLSGIRKRVGFDYKGRGRFLTDKIKIEGYSGRHVVEYYLDLLKALGIKAKDNTLDLQVNPADDLRAKNLLAALRVEEKDLVIGISPGAGGSWGREAGYKHWPALKFAQVADRLINQLKAKVILFGDDTEHPIADIIINAMRNKPIDLTGKIGLDLLPAVINNLELFICNDGGPMHIAVALGVKTVSIFGPVSEVVYGPYPDRKNHVVLAWGGACRPCYRNFRMPPCERDKECLRSIGVDDVCASAEKLIKG